MTYFGFLAQFVVIPIIALTLWTVIDFRRGKLLPYSLNGWPIWGAIGTHMIIALIYTTPWDNYLVASGVWWYDRDLVTGIVFGYVPLEEYTFFLVQPILTGLWLFMLARYLSVPDEALDSRWRVRLVPLAILVPIWIASAIILLTGWKPGTYLGLELIWALPPIMLQIAFAGDILWKYRRVITLAIVSSSIYLSVADHLAIGSGTWTIDPEQSLQIYIAGVLPIEELIFFTLTNILLVFGLTLVMARESHQRVPAMMRKWLPFAGHTSKTIVLE
jgi:lycopene cyclase domain-containing protein